MLSPGLKQGRLMMTVVTQPGLFRRTGRYNDAVLANVHAYNADLFWGQNCLQPYEPEHNTDMLIFAANMAGKVKLFLSECRIDACVSCGVFNWLLSEVTFRSV